MIYQRETALSNWLASKSELRQINHFELWIRFAERSLKDVNFWPQAITDLKPHLDAAIHWLKHCHDRNSDGGVSWGYSLKGGWRSSYRETSGYIANTFFDLAKYQGDEDAWRRAVTICHWLISVQEPDGSIANTRYGDGGLVFDTGQVLQGFIRAYQETQETQFLEAAIAAGRWLTQVADKTGKWTAHTHNGIPHVYNTRVAWKLLQLHSIHPDRNFEAIARANLDWAVSQQHQGWFQQCAFVENTAPFTHTIAYAIRGLLEAGILLNEQAYLDSAILGANAVKNYVHENGFIPGQIDVDGTAVGDYCCLTGNCQMVIIWLKLFEHTGDRSFYEAAFKSLQYVLAAQDIHSSDRNIRGGIKGSQPIWGSYTRLSYPNWAAKFFIDALNLYLGIKPCF